jgi:hypothetical protein
MKLIVCLIACLLLLGLMSVELSAQAHIVKQRARELSEQNNARQDITPNTPSAPARPAAPPAQPAGPPQPMVASPEVLRQYDINNLKNDVAAMEPGTEVKQEQSDRFTQHLKIAARGAVKPSDKTIAQLSRNLASAFAEARLTEANHAQIAEDLVNVLNCGGVPAADTQKRITSVQAALQRGGVERKLAVAVANDLKLAAAEIEKGSSKR